MTTYSPHYVSLEFSEEAKKEAFAPTPAEKSSLDDGAPPAGIASFTTGLTTFIRETGGEGVDIMEDNRDAYAELEQKFDQEGDAGGVGPGGIYDGKTEHPAQAKA